ncbi:MAG: hypothetical protein Edafosvirus1_133 [Edafosvirus sp.]|uniref:MORN repeat-containing protein n=1 Tax=Edafosvirus sp. TaxID=2487765 RepID=A0A3G4ZSB0_9VIRU|nr:MAG: hypothetical protein Edafosvirus1_133 [Edafosvirus sp.]
MSQFIENIISNINNDAIVIHKEYRKALGLYFIKDLENIVIEYASYELHNKRIQLNDYNQRYYPHRLYQSLQYGFALFGNKIGKFLVIDNLTDLYITEYRNGIKNGLKICYKQDSNHNYVKRSEATYKNNKQQKLIVTYDYKQQDSHLHEIQTILDGKSLVKQTTYIDNKLSSLFNYDPNENRIYFNPNGTKYSEGVRETNCRHYDFWYWKFYSENSNIESQGHMTKNLKHHLWKSYYENGIIKEEGKYNYGEKKGTWRYYDKDGTLIRKKYHVPKSKPKPTPYTSSGGLFQLVHDNETSSTSLRKSCDKQQIYDYNKSYIKQKKSKNKNCL